MLQYLRKIGAAEKGAINAEYALLAALIAVAAILAITGFGDSVYVLFQRLPLTPFF